MVSSSKERLSNRILTCQNEIKLAKMRLKSDNHDLRFWTNELMAAEAELHGFKQGELTLSSCEGCGA